MLLAMYGKFRSDALFWPLSLFFDLQLLFDCLLHVYLSDLLKYTRTRCVATYTAFLVRQVKQHLLPLTAV